VPSGVTITAAGTVSGNFKDIEWQSVITADGSTATTAEAGKGYFINTTSATHTITLPASPSIGDTVAIVDSHSVFNTNNCTVGRNGSNIEGSAADATLSDGDTKVTYVYSGSDRGWIPINDERITPEYIAATGGTTSTSGDYRIHTFTSTSNFVVSSVGNQTTKVDYLVVAGGGGGGNDRAGGGGGGGYRESKDSDINSPHTASPLAATTGITVTTTTYPVTVGAGGPAGTTPAGPSAPLSGSNSVFSTITSAGGGGGANGNTPNSYPTAERVGQNGGSGGGGTGSGACQGANAGSGNTPPVSPPQGNNAGPGYDTERTAGGGGGGAGNPGEAAGNPYGAGDGGKGVASSITGSSTNYSGGGGGGNTGPGPSQGGGTFGVGGINPGGSPSSPQADRFGAGVGGQSNGSPSTSTAGTANTGGGGGGGGGAQNGSAGGSGVVIIRYKYQ